jgi:sugar-specific transcriptional regulator TrmB
MCVCNNTVTAHDPFRGVFTAMSLDEYAKELSAFGLTPNQAKVYLTILQIGTAPIGQVSRLSTVRREEVYRLLPKLEKMGLVERVMGTPMKVKALPVDEALASLIKTEQDKASRRLADLAAKKEVFLHSFKPKYDPDARVETEDANFSLITERAGVLVKTDEMVRAAHRQIHAVVSRRRLPMFVASHATELKNAIGKGIDIRMITQEPDDADSIPAIIEKYLSPGTTLSLRYARRLPSRYMIVDDREALVTTSIDASFVEGPVLWSSSDSLIAFMREDFQALWNASVEWTTSRDESHQEKTQRYIRQLTSTDHVVFVYDSLEGKHDVLFHFINEGLQNGEAAAYVCSEEHSSQIRDAMKRFGIDVEKYETANALHVLDYTHFYLLGGEFSVPKTLTLWRKMYDAALSRGFTGLRVTGETACFFKHGLTHELLEYERALNRPLDIPMTGICAYNINDLHKVDASINLYTELIKTHGTVLITKPAKQLERIEIRND